MNKAWPKDRKPTPETTEYSQAQLDEWNAEIDVAVAEIEARIGPHPATKEYVAWLANQLEKSPE